MNSLHRPKLIRTATVALSLDFLLKGQLAFLRNHFEVVAVSGADEHLTEVAAREGVRTESLQMQRAISPFKDLVSLWQLYRLFRKERPLIVHSITPKAGLLSMTAAFMAGVPIRVHTFTGLVFPSKTGFMNKLLIAMDRLICRFATNIYPEGEGVKRDLIAHRITTKPLNVIANGNVNGIDTSYFSPANFSAEENAELRGSLEINNNDFVFIFVGRLVGDKGINELIAAFKSVQVAHENIKLLSVGPLEPDFDPLQTETIAEIEQNRSIISAGFQNDVRPFFAIADALVFPSYREGFPNVVLQAGAMGLPAIVTNINGCNEIIKDGFNGTIIPPKNTEALKQSMELLFNNKALYNRLASNARPLIVDRFEQQHVWQSILEEYYRLIKTSKR